MTFTTETAKLLGARGLEMQKKYKEDRMAYISSGGLNKSLVVLDMMLEGEEVTSDQKEGVKLLQGFFPYVKAKRTDEDKEGNAVQQVLVKFIDNE